MPRKADSMQTRTHQHSYVVKADIGIHPAVILE